MRRLLMCACACARRRALRGACTVFSRCCCAYVGASARAVSRAESPLTSAQLRPLCARRQGAGVSVGVPDAQRATASADIDAGAGAAAPVRALGGDEEEPGQAAAGHEPAGDAVANAATDRTGQGGAGKSGQGAAQGPAQMSVPARGGDVPGAGDVGLVRSQHACLVNCVPTCMLGKLRGPRPHMERTRRICLCACVALVPAPVAGPPLFHGMLSASWLRATDADHLVKAHGGKTGDQNTFLRAPGRAPAPRAERDTTTAAGKRAATLRTIQAKTWSWLSEEGIWKGKLFAGI